MVVTQWQRMWVMAGIAVVAFLVYLLQPILAPFLMGMLLAYLGDPLADRFEDLGLSRSWAVVAVFVVMIIIISVAMLIFIPLIGNQVDKVGEQLPVIFSLIQNQFIPWLNERFGLELSIPNLQQIKSSISSHWQTTGSVVTQFLQKVTKSSLVLVDWLFNLVLVPVVTFYLLRDWDRMVLFIRELLPRRIEPKVIRVALEIDEVLGAFLRGQLMVMFLLGVIYTFGLWIVGLDLAVLVGFTAGLASVVPYLGVIIGISFASLATLLQFPVGSELLSLLLLVWMVFGVGQIIEGFLLTPWLVGDRIGLHPVAVIFAILAGGQLFGFVGVLLALPIAAVVMVFLRHIHRNYKHSDFYDHRRGRQSKITTKASTKVTTEAPKQTP